MFVYTLQLRLESALFLSSGFPGHLNNIRMLPFCHFRCVVSIRLSRPGVVLGFVWPVFLMFRVVRFFIIKRL